MNSFQMRRMSCSAVEGPKGSRCETKLVEVEKRKREGPTWEAFRSRIFSFAQARSREFTNNRALILGQRSPVSTPTSRSPSVRSPASGSPASRSPSCRSPASRSPASRSPQSHSPARSPTRASAVRTPIQSPVTPLQRSPSGGFPPISNINFQAQKRRGSKGSKESLSGSDTPTGVKPICRRDSPTIETPTGPKGRRGRLRTFSLSFEGSEPGSMNSSLDSPSTPGTSAGRKVQLKMKANDNIPGRRGSPDQHLMELSQIDDEKNMEAAAQRPRKWSYHGTASPSTPVDIPKRHSFSTGTEQPHGNSGTMSGIVVSNSDLLSLLQPSQLLALPGLSDLKQFRTVMQKPPPACPKPRGRSQSIAVCAQSAPLMQPNAGGVDGAPIIRTTDCDHEASVLARTATLEEQPEEVEEVVIELEEKSSQDKLVWDSKAGSTVDVGILGSVIETYLKTSTEEDSECSTSKKPTYKSQPLLGSRLNAK